MRRLSCRRPTSSRILLAARFGDELFRIPSSDDGVAAFSERRLVFAAAVELCLGELPGDAERLRALRERLLARLRRDLDDVHLNGHAEKRLPGNLNVSFGGIEAEDLLREIPGIAVSTGAACSSASLEPSHVIQALGLGEARAQSSIRFGLTRFNTEAEVEYVADEVVAAVHRLRKPTASSATDDA